MSASEQPVDPRAKRRYGAVDAERGQHRHARRLHDKARTQGRRGGELVEHRDAMTGAREKCAQGQSRDAAAPNADVENSHLSAAQGA